MSGRHRAPQQPRYAARHRAPVRHTGMFSVAGIILVAAAGGVSASYALTRQSPTHPAGVHAAVLGSGTPTPTASLSPTVSPSPSTSPPPSSTTTTAAGHARRAGRSARTARVRRSSLPAPRLLLRTLNGPCWIGVTTAGGRQLVATTLPPHHRLAIATRHVHITLGNAGAVVVQVRNRHPYRAGRLGAVVSFTV